MTDFQAALGLDQIKKYKFNLKKRLINAKLYYKELNKNKDILIEKFSPNCSYFVFQIFLKNRQKLIKKFKKENIQYSIHYAKSLPSLEYYKKKYGLNQKNFKNSLLYADLNISLPIYPKLTSQEIKKICKVINEK